VTAVELIQLVSQVVWVALGVITVVRAIRQPSRANVDIALFFAGLAFVTVEGRIAAAIELPAAPLLTFLVRVIVVALPYLLIRLAHDFGSVALPVRRAAEILLAASVVAMAVFPDLPAQLTLSIVAYFVVFSLYAAVSFIRLASRSHGVTRRRMHAVAWGSYLLGIAILIAGVAIFAPALGDLTRAVTQILALASSLSYAVGFVPPTGLRRYWQLPEIRDLARRVSELPRLPTTEAIVRELEKDAGRALGAGAAIGIWDESTGALRFASPLDGLPNEIQPSAFPSWRSFTEQRPLHIADAAAALPERAEGYRRSNIRSLLVAPITAGERRLGVLVAYAPSEPIFAEDDIDLAVLLAQQAAVILESRDLIDEAAGVRAEAEAARLKEDFVSAAAHDLKTPLTTIVAQAQLLELRAQRAGRTDELPGLGRLLRETERLARLVDELLDASRLERGAFPLHPEPGDLATIARSVLTRERAGSERVELESDGAVPGLYDPERIAQLIDNLVENALKYSPDGTSVRIRVWRADGSARLAVTDQGIGIPREDLPHVFDRFRRASNVDARRFAGIGLGLYICRGIVEQHGGRIWAESVPGRGTTFHLALPSESAG